MTDSCCWCSCRRRVQRRVRGCPHSGGLAGGNRRRLDGGSRLQHTAAEEQRLGSVSDERI
jgi:hypothetical protein